MLSDSAMTQVGDGLSLTILFGYFVAGLPMVAVLFTVIWTGMRIYESYLNIKKLRRDTK